MSERPDPPRLTSVASTGPEPLRDVVRELRQATLSGESLARIEAKLGAVLDRRLPVPAAPRATTAGGLAAATGRRWLWLVAAALVVAVAAALAAERHARRAPPVESSTQPPPAGGSAAPPPPAEPTSQPTATAITPGADDASAATPRAPSPPFPAPSEGELLGRAERSLATSPSMALALADEHARRFPRGSLVQEREVIAVEALARLGRAAGARARGQAMLRAYPSSIYRTKLEQVIGSSASPHE